MVQAPGVVVVLLFCFFFLQKMDGCCRPLHVVIIVGVSRATVPTNDVRRANDSAGSEIRAALGLGILSLVGLDRGTLSRALAPAKEDSCILSPQRVYTHRLSGS
jgi:hypothetical protein